MKIGIDIDGVILQYDQVILDYINNKYNLDIKKEMLRKYNDKINGVSIKEIVWDVFKNHPKILEDIPLVEDAHRYINMLYKDKNNVIKIVTHRPGMIFKETIHSLITKDIPYVSFIMCNSYSKADMDIDILIDDKIENIYEMGEKNKYGILFIQPWNEDHIDKLEKYIENGKVYCLKDWKSIYEIIQKKEIK